MTDTALDSFETGRLALQRLTLEDAPFIFQLVNEPSWLRFIGDKGVRTLEDARGYLRTGPLDMYARRGYGLLRVALRGGPPIGICGLIKRDTLPDPDLGFAFLPRYWGTGYAAEAAQAVLDRSASELGLRRVVAITSLDNAASIRLLDKLGFRFDRLIGSQGVQLRLFSRECQP